jgi:hypothetical protein
MIEKTLVRFKTKDLFNKRLGLKEIPETSICFIEDTKEIWTHGQFYAIPNEEVFISNGEEPTGNEEIWIDLSEDSPTLDVDLSNYATKKYVDDRWFDINALLTEGEKYSEPTDITEFVNSTYGSITNLRENILLHKQLYRSHVGNNVEVIAASPNLYHIIGKYGISSMHYGYIHYDLQANDDNTSITIYKVGVLSEIVDGDGTKSLMDDGTYKEIPTNSPDYTVFDIIMEVASNTNPSISQENYNTLLEKIPNNSFNTFPIRDNEMFISSIFGGYNASDDSIWFYIRQTIGIDNTCTQIWIRQNLSIEISLSSNYLASVTDGIDIYTNVSEDSNSYNTKQLTIHTTGNGTKALMDNGSYKEIWTPDNDGSESGLDADMLDGYHINNIQLGGWYNFVTYEYTEDKVLLYNWIKLLDLSQINSDGYIELEIDVPGDNNYPTLERLFIKISRFNDNNKYNSISIKVNGLLDNEIKVLSKIDGNRTVWICIKAAWNGNKSRIRLVGQESLNIDLSSLTTQTNEPEGGSDIVYGKCGIRLDLDTNTFRYYYDPDLNEENLAYWYENDENNPSTICATGGNRNVIESLRSKFRRCIAKPYGDDTAMISYLKETDSNKWPDNSTVAIATTRKENRMVHFPKYYHKTIEVSPNVWRTYISEQQLDNDYIEEPELLLSTFEAFKNNDGVLSSIAGEQSISSQTIDEFVSQARLNGPLWSIGDYRSHATIARMFCAYYKNTDISTNNNDIPCSGGSKRYNYGLTGATVPLGNRDGKISVTNDPEYYSTNFLGLEDCYYSKLEFVQGINILKGKYVVYDGGSFPDKDVADLEAAGATNIRVVGYEPNPSATDKYSGWIKTISQGRYGDVLSTSLGGSGTTYYSDHGYFNPTGNRIFFRSGCNTDGSQCGVFFIAP